MKRVPRTVQVGRIPVTIPDTVDTETARNTAATVEAHLKAIEQDATYIDTQRFAIQAAFDFALSVQIARDALAADTTETLLALTSLQERLAEVLAVFQEGHNGGVDVAGD